MPLRTAIVTLTESHTVCGDVVALRFSRPAEYAFVPGQAMSLTLQTRSGEQSHFFSHCDAPGDETSMVLTRATGSDYKDALVALRPGDTVSMTGPYGHLTVREGVSRAAFLVGGVGITPASSIVRDAVQRASGLECLVLYGNTSEACIPLRADFAAYEKAAPNVRCVHVLSEPGPDWTGERGHIDADLVRRHCDPSDGWRFFLSGTPGMVTAMRAVLAGLDVPAASVSWEEFAGYGDRA
jgi:ferredoxin-NADP reductase